MWGEGALIVRATAKALGGPVRRGGRRPLKFGDDGHFGRSHSRQGPEQLLFCVEHVRSRPRAIGHLPTLGARLPHSGGIRRHPKQAAMPG
jgi:hypothetical protein